MNKLIIVAAFLIVFFSSNAVSQTKTCSAADTGALDKMDQKKSLASWDGMYKTYKLYRQCDDGMYAQMFSDRTVHLLAAKWNQINRLSVLTAKDRQFHKFVLRHIDATADQTELETAAAQAKNKCSARSAKLCKDIRTAAESALNELNN